jgi:hypothetical protein
MTALYSCGDESRPVGPGSDLPSDLEPLPQKAWTFFLCDDADFENAYDPLGDFSARVAEGANVNFVVLRDRNSGPGAIYSIGRSHQAHLQKSLGEINMGSAFTLEQNLDWVKTYFPAERYILAFSDHGGGWRGSCWDMTDQNDNLTMAEKRSALTATGGVDLVLFTAPCLMGAFEAAYDLRDVTDVYVASEANGGFIWWRESLPEIWQVLETTPQISNSELASSIVSTIWEKRLIHEGQSWFGSLTMSAIRTDRLNALRERLDLLSLSYLDNVESLRTLLDQVYPGLEPFSTATVDLHFLMEALLAHEKDPALIDALRAVQDALEDAVIAEKHGFQWPQARGLSLFLPDSASSGRLEHYIHPGYGLEFVDDAHWDELLYQVFPSSGIALATQPGVPISEASALPSPGLTPSGNGLTPSCAGGF